MTQAELIQQQIDTFPILPITVSRIMEVTANPECSANDLLQAILPDHSLCVTVLKLANSVLLGRPQRVDSMITAIMVLGFNEVQTIALIKAMINTFSELNLGRTGPVEQFWQHSLRTAMAAKTMAQHLRFPVSTLFMAGLIHDIGKLVMLLTFGEEYDPECWMTPFSTAERLRAEQQQFGFSHPVVGGQILRQWHFPENLLAAVEYHHQPAKAPAENKYVQVVELADLLAFLCATADEQSDDPVLLHRVQHSLPDLVLRWRSLGLGWSETHLDLWYQTLCSSQDQDRSLSDFFSP